MDSCNIMVTSRMLNKVHGHGLRLGVVIPKMETALYGSNSLLDIDFRSNFIYAWKHVIHE
jgi:hypothetical protein